MHYIVSEILGDMWLEKFLNFEGNALYTIQSATYKNIKT